MNGWALARITPTGEIDRVVELPFRRPSHSLRAELLERSKPCRYSCECDLTLPRQAESLAMNTVR